jgi:uncharacterized protein YjiS (DUF1127 family)
MVLRSRGWRFDDNYNGETSMTTLTATHLSLPALRLALQALARHWAALRRRQCDRQILSEMGPRELSDLGLGRDQIDYLTAPKLPGRWAE